MSHSYMMTTIIQIYLSLQKLISLLLNQRTTVKLFKKLIKWPLTQNKQIKLLTNQKNLLPQLENLLNQGQLLISLILNSKTKSQIIMKLQQNMLWNKNKRKKKNNNYYKNRLYKKN